MENFQKKDNEPNPEQTEVINTTEQPLLVIAGPGGDTSVIVIGIALYHAILAHARDEVRRSIRAVARIAGSVGIAFRHCAAAPVVRFTVCHTTQSIVDQRGTRGIRILSEQRGYCPVVTIVHIPRLVAFQRTVCRLQLLHVHRYVLGFVIRGISGMYRIAVCVLCLPGHLPPCKIVADALCCARFAVGCLLQPAVLSVLVGYHLIGIAVYRTARDTAEIIVRKAYRAAVPGGLRKRQVSPVLRERPLYEGYFVFRICAGYYLYHRIVPKAVSVL